MNTSVTHVIGQPTVLLCLACGQPMTPATGGYACPACGTTSGPVAR